MQLITAEIRNAAPNLYSNETKEADQIPVIAKFFTPWSGWTWYMTEFEPENRIAFGYVVGLDEELGYFDINELESIQGPGGLTIERDLHFGKHMLSEIMNGARP